MCTLILGVDVVAPRTVVLAANRDEDPARLSDPPHVLRENPRIVGGSDRRAGGTWLAVRDRRAVVAVLNRRDPGPASGAGPRRSRGQLVLDVAAAEGPDLGRAALERAQTAVRSPGYGPFTLVYASSDACWALAHDGAPTDVPSIGRGWHVLTHADIDDRSEPRTAWLMDALSGFSPRSRGEAKLRLSELLKTHPDRGAPAVCIHEGRMPTVSAALLWLAAGELSYLHAEGRPCEHAFEDFGALLAPAASERG